MTKARLLKKTLFWLSAIVAGLLVVGLLAALIIINRLPEAPAEVTTVATTLPPPEKTELRPEDFQYDGQYLTCTATPTVLGIDVSSYQGAIDWQAVREAGVEFAMIRVGGRGYGAMGKIYFDDMAQTYYQGAREAGIKVGVYFFSQAISSGEAREEALATLEIVKDWELDMPIVYDWEVIDAEGSRTKEVDPRIVTNCMKAFCEVIEENGKTPMIYFNPTLSMTQVYMEEVTDYDFWLAFYTDWNTYPYKVKMWQYTCEGAVPGIAGNVDLNLLFSEME